ncbi:MAG: regulatory protein RecX [Microscillaceae bacterium]|nr:regulatory protein RecX [Microscillaceae bacterium]
MKKAYTIQQAYVKASKFCAYQERTQQEVREKIYSYGIFGEEAEEVICQLIADNFINEERFAKAYAGGKFRLKKWGRLKIERNLRQKGLSQYCIRQGLAEIEQQEYEQTLEQLLHKKRELLQGIEAWEMRQKLFQFLSFKGYESELILEKIQELEKKHK